MRKKTILKWSLMGGSGGFLIWIIYYFFVTATYRYNTIEISAAELLLRRPGISNMEGISATTVAGTIGFNVLINNRNEGTAGRLITITSKTTALKFAQLPTSVFPISTLHIRRLLEIRNAAYFVLTPVYYPSNTKYVSYRITPLDINRNPIVVPGNPGYLNLNPSPPASRGGYEEQIAQQ
jgi:hypothetical protein